MTAKKAQFPVRRAGRRLLLPPFPSPQNRGLMLKSEHVGSHQAFLSAFAYLQPCGNNNETIHAHVTAAVDVVFVVVFAEGDVAAAVVAAVARLVHVSRGDQSNSSAVSRPCEKFCFHFVGPPTCWRRTCVLF